MRLSEAPLFTADEIESRVSELACQIGHAYSSRDLVLLAVLKGATVFVADLMRRLRVPVSVEFVRARSYDGNFSNGALEFVYLPERPLTDRHVLIVEDILDTGKTTARIVERVQDDRPASLALCVFLDKPARRQAAVKADYVGFTIDDHFVVGYGLDYGERYRELPHIHVLEGV